MKKIRNLSAKERKKIHIWIRALIQLAFFLFFPSAFTAAFAGVKYIFTQIGAGDAIVLTSFMAVLIVLCLYTILFGRFFCGFACAFGSLGDAVRALYLFVCKKLKKKPVKLPQDRIKWMLLLKYIVLAVILFLCFLGVCGKTQGTSPWEVFSMLHAGNFRLGSHVIGIIILLVLLVAMCIQERFFCRFLCPMGAVFSLLPVLPFVTLCRDREACIPGCSACSRQCPAAIELPEAGHAEVAPDCFQCQKCIDTCPKGNIHCALSKIKGNEIIFTLLKTGILIGLYLWLEI